MHKETEKTDLFTLEHPVVKQLREIPEILFDENELKKRTASAVSLKKLFARKQMDENHVDFLVLYKIALGVLHILQAFSVRNIFPGLIEIGDIYADLGIAGPKVYLLHPEKFQLLDFEQDYEWYPEDERIFGEMELFDASAQKQADIRLLYKILVASAKGNVKIPPKQTEADYSELFYKALPDEWKQVFREDEEYDYDVLQQMLCQCIEMEESFAKQARERMDEKEEKRIREQAHDREKQQKECGKTLCCMFVFLRTELENARKISRMIYQLQDELEIEADLSHLLYAQAFVFGDGSIAAQNFAVYEKGFRCQCRQQIKEYSAGEALIIAAEMMKEKMEICQEGEYRMYALADGSLKNDRIFQAALSLLKERQREGMKFSLLSDKDSQCEACFKLKNLNKNQEDIHVDSRN